MWESGTVEPRGRNLRAYLEVHQTPKGAGPMNASGGGTVRFPGEEEWTEAVLERLVPETRHQREEQSRRIWRAMMLSPTVEVCDALLRGESVPVRD